MAYEPQINTWPGTSKFSAGKTSFGYYDADAAFISDSDKVASWCAKRLGYPIVDVELVDENFYSAFEEAIMEYGKYVHLYNAIDNILELKGSTIGSKNLSGNYITPTMKGVFKLAKKYGEDNPAGGQKTWYTGKIKVRPNTQVYMLNDSTDIELSQGDPETDNFTIRKLYHYPNPTNRVSVGMATNMSDILNEFGFNQIDNSYLMYPLNYDVQFMQAIELQREIKRSSYSFKLTGNKIRIFPIPSVEGYVYFDYTLDDEMFDNMDQSESLITDISNIPYANIKYSKINSIGKGWIKQYTLAISKEMLSLIRGKYSNIPIPGSEVTLNGGELATQAQEEKRQLIDELKEYLENNTNAKLLQRRQEETDALNLVQSGVPSKIYIR